MHCQSTVKIFCSFPLLEVPLSEFFCNALGVFSLASFRMTWTWSELVWVAPRLVTSS